MSTGDEKFFQEKAAWLAGDNPSGRYCRDPSPFQLVETTLTVPTSPKLKTSIRLGKRKRPCEDEGPKRKKKKVPMGENGTVIVKAFRLSKPRPSKKMVEPKPFKFKAKPVPVFKPVVKKPLSKKALTTCKAFNLSKGNGKSRASSATPPVPRKSFKAAPAPKFPTPKYLHKRASPKPILKPKPFNFKTDMRGAARKNVKQRQLENDQKSAQQKRVFKAIPVPKYPKPEARQKGTKAPTVFTLGRLPSEIRAEKSKVAREKLKQTMEMKKARELEEKRKKEKELEEKRQREWEKNAFKATYVPDFAKLHAKEERRLQSVAPRPLTLPALPFKHRALKETDLRSRASSTTSQRSAASSPSPSASPPSSSKSSVASSPNISLIKPAPSTNPSRPVLVETTPNAGKKDVRIPEKSAPGGGEAKIPHELDFSA